MAEVLAGHGVATIVDVRSHPHSRHAPEFARPVLDGLAAASGFGYRWMGDALGGRPTDPSLLAADGTLDEGGPAPLAPVPGGPGRPRGPRRRGSRWPCSAPRSEPEHCHRARVIAPALEEMGVRVVHLLHDGTALAHQDSLGI